MTTNRINKDGSVEGRAYSMLEVKAITEDEDFWHIEGIATTPTTDRYGDKVQPMGANFVIPMPLLWQHDSHKPVGTLTSAKKTKTGIPYKASLPKVKEAGVLKDRIDEAVQSIKYKLVAAVSIGFRALKGAYEVMDNGGIDFKEWEWLELSLVTIPANADATITSIKSFDRQVLSALGKDDLEDDDLVKTKSGVSGKSKPVKLSKGNEMKKTIAELIAEFEAKKKELLSDAQALIEKSTEEGRTFDETEEEQHDEIMAEVASVERHIKRLKAQEKANVEDATSVETAAGVTDKGASVSRAGSAIITVTPNLPKGTAFTRYVMALTQAKGNAFEALQRSNEMFKDTPQVVNVLRAAVAAGTTTDADWASKLVDYTTMVGEFIELLRPMTIMGKFGLNGVPSLRQVPFNIRMASQTGGGSYGWVGEGKASSVGRLTVGEVTLKWAKASGIIVVTDELMRVSSPSVEQIVRNDMLSGMAEFSDVQFVDPSIAAVADTSPASITNGATNVVPASGTDADALRADIKTLIGAFFTANLAPTTGVFIMSNRQALAISLMRNALGNKEYPDMTPTGGILEGFPVIASESVPDASDGGIIIFVNANDVFFSDDGPVTIDASREASLQMDSAPDEPSSASTVMQSLWQRHLVALRAERYMNWKLRRAAAVGYIESTNYV